jgi:hypothetical protein
VTEPAAAAAHAPFGLPFPAGASPDSGAGVAGTGTRSNVVAVLATTLGGRIRQTRPEEVTDRLLCGGDEHWTIWLAAPARRGRGGAAPPCLPDAHAP